MQARDADRARARARTRSVLRPRRRARAPSRRCAASTRTASTSWSRSTARTTSRSTPSSRRSPGSRAAARALRDERPPARDRDGEAPRDRRARVRAPAAPARTSTVVVDGAEDTERHKPDPEPVLEALERLGARAGGRRLRRRLAVRHPRGEGGGRCTRSPSAGAASTPTTRLEPRSPTPSSTRRRSCLASSDPAGRARDELRGLARRTTSTATTSSTTPRSRDADVRRALRRARRARGGAPGARHARLADPARRRAAVASASRRSQHLDADGVAREGDDRRGARRSGPTTSASGSAPTSPSRT